MNKRLLSLFVSISVVTTATFSGGFPVFAGNEETPILDAAEQVEANILESVDKLLEKKDATSSDATTEVKQEETATVNTDDTSGASSDVIVIDTGDTTSDSSGIRLTATAEDGMVVIVDADKEAFPYDDLTLVVHVVTGTEAEEASDEIDAKKPKENTAKRVTYDVQVQSNGVEVQPAEGKKVNVSFKVPDVPSGADEVIVYHHDETDGKLEEIASTELTEASAAVVNTAETNVSISNSEGAKTSAVTYTDTDDDEYYADYEVEDDVTVKGETGSFSLYTVDFTYDQKTVSIAGDTKKNELSKILEQIGITDAIVEAVAYMDADCTQPAADNTVTVDGKNLFRVYSEGGVWYVDALNAFSTTHGLLIKTADAEYKVKVTDTKLLFIVRPVEGAKIFLEGKLAEVDTFIYGDKEGTCIGRSAIINGSYYCESRAIQYYSGNNCYTLEISAEALPGYQLVFYWNEEIDPQYPGVSICYMEVKQISAPITITAGNGGTVENGGTITVGMDAHITQLGSSLTIDGYDPVITAKPTKDSLYQFDHWEINPKSDVVVSGMTIEAVFKSIASPVTVKATKTCPNGDPAKAGKIYPAESAVVAAGSTITGNKDDLTTSNILTIDGEVFEAVAEENYQFKQWKSIPADAKVTADTTLEAEFIRVDNPRIITFIDPYYGTYKKSFSSKSITVIDQAKLKVNGNKLTIGDNVYTIEAEANKDYEFVGWLDENGNFLTGEITVTDDMEIHATFKLAKSQYVAISAATGGNLIYRGVPMETVIFAVEGMTGTLIKQDTSNPFRLIISYVDANKTTVTESVDAVADSGYKLSQTPWEGIPADTTFDKANITAKFEVDYADVTLGVSGDTTGSCKLYYNNQAFASNTIQVPNGKAIITYGSRMMFDGMTKPVIASSSNAAYVFDHWDISSSGDRVDGDTTITAVFENVGSSYMVTPKVNVVGYGKVYPTDSVRVAATSTVEGTKENAVVKIGKETFTAVSEPGKYFTKWETPGYTDWTQPLPGDIDLEAHFIALDSSAIDLEFATPTNGTYQKSFEGDTLKVPNGASFKVEGKTITIGGGKAYIKAVPDKDCEFIGWYDAGKNDMLADGSESVTAPKYLVAQFKYTKAPDPIIIVEEPEPTPTNPVGGSSPGSTSATNYHAEHTYGSMEEPINDGVWELLDNGTWKYNWRIPMASAWGCIVNPYAEKERGQAPYGWFFFDPYGIMQTGWRLVDGKWYYLEPISNGCRGQLYTNTTTPDGYKVDENGAWIK